VSSPYLFYRSCTQVEHWKKTAPFYFGNNFARWRRGAVVGSSLSRARSVKTLGKFLIPMCLCSPSSISWYRPKGGDALRLGSKGRYGSCGWYVKLCDPLVTRVISERFEWWYTTIKRYINTRYFTYYLLTCQVFVYQNNYWLTYMYTSINLKQDGIIITNLSCEKQHT